MPQATSSTFAPGVMGRRFTKASAPAEIVLAMTPKSPAVHAARMEFLICSMLGPAALM